MRTDHPVRTLIVALAATLWLALAGVAQANCTVATPAMLDFGTLTASGTAVARDASSTITVTCDNASNHYTLCLDAGASLSAGSRHVADGSFRLPYALQQVDANGVPWGDNSCGGSFAGDHYSSQGSGTVTVYGSMSVAPGHVGVHNDNVSVRLYNSDCNGSSCSGTPDSTATLAVRAQVVASCAVSTSPIDFGSTVAGSAATRSTTGGVHLVCSGDSPVVVALGAGLSPAGGKRRMSSGSDYVPYTLTIHAGDNNAGQEWGTNGITPGGTGLDTFNGPSVSRTIAPGTMNYTIDARVDIPASAPAGNYSDTVKVYVEY